MEDGRQQQKDVVLEILVRLPVRSVLRFKSISKFWCNLIKSPTFINKHQLKRQMICSVLLIRRYLPSEESDMLSFHNFDSQELEEKRWPRVSIPILKDLRYKYDQTYGHQTVHILGPCRGLVCIISDECIIFCNPALHEFKQIPICPVPCPKDYYHCLLGEGFGNSSSNDFKVVLIHTINPDDYYADDPRRVAQLYNSSTNSWREIESTGKVIPFVEHVSCSEVVLNGSIHWNADSAGPGVSDVILTFDIDTELLGELEYPDCVKVLDGNQHSLTALNGCIALIRYRQWMKEPHLITVWIMKEYGVKESWIKQFETGPYFIICPILPWKRDEWLIVESDQGQLASCSLHTNEITKFQLRGEVETLRAIVYEDSLISLKQVLPA